MIPATVTDPPPAHLPPPTHTPQPTAEIPEAPPLPEGHQKLPRWSPPLPNYRRPKPAPFHLNTLLILVLQAALALAACNQDPPSCTPDMTVLQPTPRPPRTRDMEIGPFDGGRPDSGTAAPARRARRMNAAAQEQVARGDAEDDLAAAAARIRVSDIRTRHYYIP